MEFIIDFMEENCQKTLVDFFLDNMKLSDIEKILNGKETLFIYLLTKENKQQNEIADILDVSGARISTMKKHIIQKIHRKIKETRLCFNCPRGCRTIKINKCPKCIRSMKIPNPIIIGKEYTGYDMDYYDKQKDKFYKPTGYICKGRIGDLNADNIIEYKDNDEYFYIRLGKQKASLV